MVCNRQVAEQWGLTPNGHQTEITFPIDFNFVFNVISCLNANSGYNVQFADDRYTVPHKITVHGFQKPYDDTGTGHIYCTAYIAIGI